jgi:hypothetical protein
LGYKKRNILISKSIDLNIRKNLLKTYIWSIMLYGCETWTIEREEMRRLEAFKMQCYRGCKRYVGLIELLMKKFKKGYRRENQCGRV